jgi:mono/diheme cytochrome c family protein
MARISRFIRATAILATGLWLFNSGARPADAQDAKQLYDKHCVMCHGPSGKGDGPAGKMLKPPPAELATAIKGKADADIAKVIKEGGKAVGKSAAMLAFGNKLKEDEIRSVVEYVKGFK